MNKRKWSADDRAEYELLVSEALREPAVPARREIFLSGVDAAAARKRHWARDVLKGIRDEGADKALKYEQELRRPKVSIAHNGRLLGKVPRVLGVPRRDDEGKLRNERALFDVMTWDELRAKLPLFAQQIEAYERDAHAVIRLLALESHAPGAKTPADACELLGITVEEWLVSEDAA